MTSTYNATPDQNTYPHTSTYTTHTHHAHTDTHTHISSLQHLHETENLSWNSSFWGQGNVVHILGSTTNWRWWRNSTLDSPLCWQSLLNAWRLSFVEDQRGRVRRLELLAREDIRIEPWYLSLLWSGLLYTLMEIRETAGRVFIDNKRSSHQEIPPSCL